MSKRTLASSPGGVRHYYRYLHCQGGRIFPDAVQHAANRVHYTPFEIEIPMTIDGVIIVHYDPSTGNYYSALYQSLLESPTARLALSAITATNGTYRKQLIPFTVPVSLQPGYYFGAIIKSAALNLDYEGTLTELTLPAGVANGPSFYYEDMGGFLAPPANATPIQSDDTIRTMGMILRVSSIP